MAEICSYPRRTIDLLAVVDAFFATPVLPPSFAFFILNLFLRLCFTFND